MSDLTVVVIFTKNSGQPATGLTLADIDLYLTQQDRATGVDTVVWNGAQNPTVEMDNVGAYIRILTTADLDAYNYFAAAEYGGAQVLDADWAIGALSLNNIPLGTAIAYTYTVTNQNTSLPIEGVEVEVTTDMVGLNTVWVGHTDAFGVARDAYGNLPRLDAGTYYFFKQLAGWVDVQNPDTEVVS